MTANQKPECEHEQFGVFGNHSVICWDCNKEWKFVGDFIQEKCNISRNSALDEAVKLIEERMLEPMIEYRHAKMTPSETSLSAAIIDLIDELKSALDGLRKK